MPCRLGTPPSEVEEWTAGVSVHYRMGTFLGYVFVLWIMLYGLVFLSELWRFEDSAEFPPCIFAFQFLAYIINDFEFCLYLCLVGKVRWNCCQAKGRDPLWGLARSIPSPADLGCYNLVEKMTCVVSSSRISTTWPKEHPTLITFLGLYLLSPFDLCTLVFDLAGLNLNFSSILDISNFDDECEILVKYDYPFYAYFIWS